MEEGTGSRSSWRVVATDLSCLRVMMMMMDWKSAALVAAVFCWFSWEQIRKFMSVIQFLIGLRPMRSFLRRVFFLGHSPLLPYGSRWRRTIPAQIITSSWKHYSSTHHYREYRIFNQCNPEAEVVMALPNRSFCCISEVYRAQIFKLFVQLLSRVRVHILETENSDTETANWHEKCAFNGCFVRRRSVPR